MWSVELGIGDAGVEILNDWGKVVGVEGWRKTLRNRGLWITGNREGCARERERRGEGGREVVEGVERERESVCG